MRRTKNTKRNNSKLFETILFSLPEMIFVFNKSGKFIDFHNESQNTLYLDPNEFLGRPVTETNLPENIKNTIVKVISKVFDDGKNRRFQYFLMINGEKKHYEARFFYGDQDTVFSIVRDVTSIKKSEITHKQLKAYYQTILDRMDQSVIETTVTGKINYVNNAFIKLTGKSKTHLIGQNFFDVFGLKVEKQKISKYFRTGNNHNNCYIFESNQLGQINTQNFKISVVSSQNDEEKEPLYNITIEDITDAKQKEDILKRSESTYRNLVESSPNGILIQSETQILYANPAAFTILGVDNLQQLEDLNFKNMLLPEFVPIVVEQFNELKKGNTVTYTEIKVKRPKDGKIIELEIIPARIYYEGSEVFQIILKDISIQKHLQETKLRAEIAEESYHKLRKEIVIRQEMEQKLSRSLEEKNILLKEVHHRVKNNLQIISSILNLEIRSQSEQNVSQALRRIQNRIYSIYLVHEIVYQTDMLSRIDLGQYLKLISENMARNSEYDQLRFKFNLETVYVSLEIGVPIGMIINELFSNYFDNYSEFEENKSLIISMKQENTQTEIQICYPKIKLSKKKISVVESSLSSQLIEALVDQINGIFNIHQDNKNNITFVLQF